VASSPGSNAKDGRKAALVSLAVAGWVLPARADTAGTIFTRAGIDYVAAGSAMDKVMAQASIDNFITSTTMDDIIMNSSNIDARPKSLAIATNRPFSSMHVVLC
jgi:hypothetical protein